MDAVAHDQPAEEVRTPGRKALKERIFAVLAPAADHVELVLFEVGDQLGDIGGVVLQVSVHGDDIVVLRGVNTRVHGRRLAEVAAQADEFDRSKRLCQFNGFVLRPVVHKNDLVRQTRFFQHGFDLAVEFQNVPFLVKQRRYDRNALHAAFPFFFLPRAFRTHSRLYSAAAKAETPA